MYLFNNSGMKRNLNNKKGERKLKKLRNKLRWPWNIAKKFLQQKRQNGAIQFFN